MNGGFILARKEKPILLRGGATLALRALPAATGAATAQEAATGEDRTQGTAAERDAAPADDAGAGTRNRVVASVDAAEIRESDVTDMIAAPQERPL